MLFKDDSQQYGTLARTFRYEKRADYLSTRKTQTIDTSPTNSTLAWFKQKISNARKHCKNIYNLFSSSDSATTQTPLEKLAALKHVLRGKLKHLAHDPRKYKEIEAEIVTTKQEWDNVNYAILQAIIGDEILNTIIKRLSISNENDKLQILFEIDGINKNISSIINPDILKNNQKNIQQQILNSLFFDKKNINISKRLKQLHIEHDQDVLKKEAAFEIAQRTIALNNANIRYLISIIGKFIAFNYALSQVVSLAFMCIVMLIACYALLPALITAIWWVPIVYFGSGALLILWWMQGTGAINWHGCRDNIPNMLIDFWNMIINKNDVAYTNWQNAKNFDAFTESAICGFVSGFFVHYIIIQGLILLGAGASITGLALIFTIPLAVLGGLNMFLFMYKYRRETALSGSVFKDGWLFLRVIFASNPGKIAQLKNKIKSKYQERYQHLYFGDKLNEKVNDKFNKSILGKILNYNEQAAYAPGKWWVNTLGIYLRGLFMIFVAFICVPLVIGGIIYGQLASFHALADLLEGLLSITESAAQSFSKLLCFLSGTAYLSSFTYATVSCGTNLAYGVTQTLDRKDEKEATYIEMIDFQQKRLANGTDNGGQTAFGFIDSKRKKDESGELEPLEDAIVDVFSNTGEITKFAVFTGAATLASIAFASAPGDRVDFNGKLNAAAKKHTIALENARRKKVTLDIPYQNGTSTHKVQIYLADPDLVADRESDYAKEIQPLLNLFNISFTNIAQSLYANEEACIHLHLNDDNYQITLQTTSYFKRKIFKNGKDDQQPYVDAVQILEILKSYKEAKDSNTPDAIHNWKKQWHDEQKGVQILSKAQNEAEYKKRNTFQKPFQKQTLLK